MKERWKAIALFPNYAVSNWGRIRGPRKMLRRCWTKKGYATVSLFKAGKHFTRTIHRLVAEAFIPNPLGLPTVNHKDGVKARCRVTNLEWASYSQQEKHALTLGLKRPPAGSRNGRAMLGTQDVKRIRLLISSGRSQKSVADEYGITPQTVSKIVHGVRWKHV